MISTRYVPAVCVLVALALVPTVIHSFVGDTAEDGRHAAAIPGEIAGFIGTPTPRNPGWGAARFESDDWFERTYVAGQDQVVLTVVRSFDLKRLYHHAELDIAYGTPFVSYETTRLVSEPERPIHVLRTAERTTIALYALHYGDGFVEHPLRFQLQTAGELLFSRRKPMTIFFARQTGVRPDADIAGLSAQRVLFGAIDRFLAQPGDSGG